MRRNGRGWLTPRPVSLPWLGEAIGTAEWTGTPLRALLADAGLAAGAVEVVFRAADRGLQGDEEQSYARSLAVSEATRPEVLLAYEMNGHALEPQHGFPLRLVVPGWYGMTSVKWLTAIEVVTEAFEGFQQAVAYRYQQDADDPGDPVSRIRVRALMIPPGPGLLLPPPVRRSWLVALSGRAWSGNGPVERVEVAVDGQWADATLATRVGEFAWHGWSFEWDATTGEHELACRATDAAGNVHRSRHRGITRAWATTSSSASSSPSVERPPALAGAAYRATSEGPRWGPLRCLLRTRSRRLSTRRVARRRASVVLYTPGTRSSGAA